MTNDGNRLEKYGTIRKNVSANYISEHLFPFVRSCSYSSASVRSDREIVECLIVGWPTIIVESGMKRPSPNRPFQTTKPIE